jgi:hypothetical protein
MGFFSSSNKPSNLDLCLETKQDVGNYKWFPETSYPEIVGSSNYQTELSKLYKKYGENKANVRMDREPTNKFDKKAIAIYCDGLIIGHVAKSELKKWHEIFNFVGDENTMFVGTTSIDWWANGKMFLPSVVMQVSDKLPIIS